MTGVAAPDGWPTCSKERSGTKIRTRFGMERPLSRKPHKSEWMGEGNRNELVEIHR